MSSPFVRRRRLAAELRALREEHGLTAEQLSQRLYRSRMKISRLENARGRPDIAAVIKILDALDVTGDRREKIITIAVEAAERGWWDSFGNSMGRRQRLYADVESGAATIRGYNQMSISGLLQAAEFHQALIDLDAAEAPELDYVPARIIEARRMRQETVFRPDGPTCEIILDEYVLKRLPVPPAVMAAQLRHMVDVLSHQPRFTLRLLPLDVRIITGSLQASSFMLYTFPDLADPPMVVSEMFTTDLVLTKPEEVASYERHYDRLSQAALPALESLSHFADTADRLNEQIGSGT
ncbi:helix-turn-helix domain-containing protein [Actinomadura rugatobispora]|uniref:Helix-turn-helix domain-containing protein n=1 Tax=Actinomadura rugatobispora TaxID=1994 RepID=A0ABW1AGC4_9ACTN|nr:helix-turn-helix transcriptional regulator [Actinomadura rugatobispora]